jgi:hypothetical protein
MLTWSSSGAHGWKMEGLKWLLEGNDARVRAGLQHLLQGRRIEVCPEPEEGCSSPVRYASPQTKTRRPGRNPERLVRVVAGGL